MCVLWIEDVKAQRHRLTIIRLFTCFPNYLGAVKNLFCCLDFLSLHFWINVPKDFCNRRKLLSIFQIFVQLQRYEEVEHSARIGEPFLSCAGKVLDNFGVVFRLKILYPWCFS